MARYYLKTYGCKVNQCDSDSLASRLESWGLEPTDDLRVEVLCGQRGSHEHEHDDRPLTERRYQWLSGADGRRFAFRERRRRDDDDHCRQPDGERDSSNGTSGIIVRTALWRVVGLYGRGAAVLFSLSFS